MNEKSRKIRFVILEFIVVLVSMVLIFRLFDLQIIHGEENRNKSQQQLFRQASIKAPRGEFYDRNGKLLVTNREAFNVQIVKVVDIKPEQFNRIILSLIKVLEKNGDKYIDNFPITVNPIRLNLDKLEGANDLEKRQNFLKKFKIKDLNCSDEEIFGYIVNYYNIPDDFTIEDARKVMAVRYEISQQPFSLFDPVTIAIDVSKETVAELVERHLEFPGVNISVEPIRNYPYGSVAAHIIGYIGKIDKEELEKRKNKGYGYNDIIGKDGLEYLMEEFLRGKDGRKEIHMDTMGRMTGEVGGSSPEPGDNIYLTIDLELQKTAEKSLENTIKMIREGKYGDRFEAKAGSVIVMDVKTGEILALANYPSYDPSLFVKGISLADWTKLMDEETRPLFNRAIAGVYSPGSTFKMVTAIAALEEGKVSVDEKILDKGVYTRYKGYHPKCWIWSREHRTHGYVDVSKAIQVSCNYFFYEVGYRTGIDGINKYAKMFGLGNKTGIELPGEKDGILAGPEFRKSLKRPWYVGETLSAAIGQSDYSFTPIQMVNYVATLANGGLRNRPHLISKITKGDGELVPEDEVKKLLVSKLGETIYNYPVLLNLKKENLDAVLEGMRSVTGDAGGTAYGTFAGFPVQVAGKTGTVEVPGYYKNGKKKSEHAWFVGFAPYGDPKIAVAVIIEHGGRGSYTAPVARDIFAQYFLKSSEGPKQD